MKRFLFFTVILTLFFITACSENNDGNNNQENAEEEKEIEEMAEDFFAHFINEQYEDAIQYFDETMSKELPAAELEKLKVMISEQLGKFIDSEYADTQEKDGYKIVILKASYEVSDVNIIITFNAQKEIAGFYFQ